MVAKTTARKLNRPQTKCLKQAISILMLKIYFIAKVFTVIHLYATTAKTGGKCKLRLVFEEIGACRLTVTLL